MRFTSVFSLVIATVVGCSTTHGSDDAVGSDAGADVRVTTDASVPFDAALGCQAGSECSIGGATASCCEGRCIDTSADSANCGYCGTRCPTGMQCANGHCSYGSCTGAIPGLPAPPSPGVTPSTTAPCTLANGADGTCCGGNCVNPMIFDGDAMNCGGCGLVCPTGDTCTSGACMHDGPACGDATLPACPAGTTCWSARACLPTSCVMHADGTVCALASGSLGACCGGACVDASTDGANCGACAHACSAGSACILGACYAPPSCMANGTSDGPCVLASGAVGRCCGTQCVDATSDTVNCGSCGIACQGGSSCVAMGASGECGTTTTGGGFSASFCTGPGMCPAGTDCYTGGASVGFCARLDCTGVADGSPCYVPNSPSSGMCCAGACVDPTSDPNCGGCGVACPSGVCIALPGAIRSLVSCLPPPVSSDCSAIGGCPIGDTCIGGACVAQACGDYGQLCASAAHTVGICCAQSPGDPPMCIDVANDSANCGQCGTTCPAGQSCARGRCH